MRAQSVRVSDSQSVALRLIIIIKVRFAYYMQANKICGGRVDILSLFLNGECFGFEIFIGLQLPS